MSLFVQLPGIFSQNNQQGQPPVNPSLGLFRFPRVSSVGRPYIDFIEEIYLKEGIFISELIGESNRLFTYLEVDFLADAKLITDNSFPNLPRFYEGMVFNEVQLKDGKLVSDTLLEFILDDTASRPPGFIDTEPNQLEGDLPLCGELPTVFTPLLFEITETLEGAYISFLTVQNLLEYPLQAPLSFLYDATSLEFKAIGLNQFIDYTFDVSITVVDASYVGNSILVI